MESRLIVPAHIDKIPYVLEWARSHLQPLGFAKKAILHMELALEEAFINSVFHGYQGKEGTVELEFISFAPNHVVFILTDEGPAFNPLKEAPEIDTSKPLNEREIGGMGIYLMRQLVDEIHYDRKQGRNQLKFIKRFSRTL